MSKFLNKNFFFTFVHNKSLFFFKGLNGILVFKLPSFFFFKKNYLSISFFFFQRKHFVNFLSNLFLFYQNFFSLFFLKFKIRGLGYRIRFLKKGLFRFFLGTTNYIYFHSSKDILIRTRRRRMILVSHNFSSLRLTFINFLFLKKLIPYKLRGVFFPRQIILLKPGKKKF